MSGRPITQTLAVLATPTVCRGRTTTRGLRSDGKCQGSPVRVVTLVCEHEHVFDAALCDDHIAHVPTTRMGCPLCRVATEDAHRCRAGVLSGGAA